MKLKELLQVIVIDVIFIVHSECNYSPHKES